MSVLNDLLDYAVMLAGSVVAFQFLETVWEFSPRQRTAVFTER
jgi:hypothetical protein